VQCIKAIHRTKNKREISDTIDIEVAEAKAICILDSEYVQNTATLCIFCETFALANIFHMSLADFLFLILIPGVLTIQSLVLLPPHGQMMCARQSTLDFQK